jgi:hypothetical protein
MIIFNHLELYQHFFQAIFYKNIQIMHFFRLPNVDLFTLSGNSVFFMESETACLNYQIFVRFHITKAKVCFYEIYGFFTRMSRLYTLILKNNNIIKLL